MRPKCLAGYLGYIITTLTDKNATWDKKTMEEMFIIFGTGMRRPSTPFWTVPNEGASHFQWDRLWVQLKISPEEGKRQLNEQIRRFAKTPEYPKFLESLPNQLFLTDGTAPKISAWWADKDLEKSLYEGKASTPRLEHLRRRYLSAQPEALKAEIMPRLKILMGEGGELVSEDPALASATLSPPAKAKQTERRTSWWQRLFQRLFGGRR